MADIKKVFNLIVIKEMPCKETIKYHLTYLMKIQYNSTVNNYKYVNVKTEKVQIIVIIIFISHPKKRMKNETRF